MEVGSEVHGQVIQEKCLYFPLRFAINLKLPFSKKKHLFYQKTNGIKTLSVVTMWASRRWETDLCSQYLPLPFFPWCSYSTPFYVSMQNNLFIHWPNEWSPLHSYPVKESSGTKREGWENWSDKENLDVHSHSRPIICGLWRGHTPRQNHVGRKPYRSGSRGNQTGVLQSTLMTTRQCMDLLRNPPPPHPSTAFSTQTIKRHSTSKFSHTSKSHYPGSSYRIMATTPNPSQGSLWGLTHFPHRLPNPKTNSSILNVTWIQQWPKLY